MTVAVACGSDVTAPGMWTQFPQPPSKWRIAIVEKVGSMGARLYTLGLFKLATESALAGNQLSTDYPYTKYCIYAAHIGHSSTHFALLPFSLQEGQSE